MYNDHTNPYIEKCQIFHFKILCIKIRVKNPGLFTLIPFGDGLHLNFGSYFKSNPAKSFTILFLALGTCLMTNSDPRKQKPYSTKSPQETWDYIIIGSGMGGMTCGALLTKLGKKVLILEQHYVPGGFTHTFRRTKWHWDVGVHAVGEVTSHSMVGRLLGKLTNENLRWASLGEVYDEFHFPGNFRIDFPNHPDKFRANLEAAFPDEKEAIGKYLRYVKQVAGTMKKYYLCRTLPYRMGVSAEKIWAKDARRFLLNRTNDVLDQLTTNEKLKTVIASQWGYYGSPPADSSFAIQALVAKHFSHGGYYPEGGSKKIADELLSTIATGGGWTRIRASVDEVLFVGKKAVGVRLEKGEKIFAKNVISAIGAIETIDHLLPEPEKKKTWAREIKKLKPSPCHVCLYLGFKGDIRKAGASAANKWFWETWDSNFQSWDIKDPGAPAPVLYTSFPSLKDPLHQPGEEQLHTGEAVTFVPYEDFQKWQGSKVMKRGEEYSDLKEQLTQRLLSQLLKYMPGLEPMIAHVELSTPLSCETYTKAAAGAIYGITPTPKRFQNPWLRPRTPLKNFYLSGSDVATVGVVGAMVGGVLTAVAAEPWKAIGYIKKSAKK